MTKIQYIKSNDIVYAYKDKGSVYHLRTEPM